MGSPQERAAFFAYREAGRELWEALDVIGFRVETLGDLREFPRYDAAVPVLLEFLRRVTYPPLALDILGVLTVPRLKNQIRPRLIELLWGPPELADPSVPQPPELWRNNFRWAVGQVLGNLADPSVAEEYLSLAQAREFGDARGSIIMSLPKTKDSRVCSVLIALLDDPDVAAWAAKTLGKARCPEAVGPLTAALGSEHEEVRRQARAALRRLEGARRGEG